MSHYLTKDVHSFSDVNAYRTKYLNLDLCVSFGKKVLTGHVDLTLKRVQKSHEMRNDLSGANSILVLDSRDLNIASISLVDSELSTNKLMPLKWFLGKADVDRSQCPDEKLWQYFQNHLSISVELEKTLGTPLLIALPANIAEELVIRVEYETSPHAVALQWMDPLQTAGGKYPFLYSQGYPICTRSWIPCQDTASVRVTYSARIRILDAPVPFRAIMSARNNWLLSGEESDCYEFEMPQAIPSYLIVLAVGNLDFQAISHRVGVIAEPELLQKAAQEYVDAEKMVETAESLYGPYQWERFDVVMMPTSFPYGGMENPRVTFLNGSVLAGDRSLVSIVAHELAHSWSGNLVTNGTWAHFWLNEGVTTYIESRILEKLYGKERSDVRDVLRHRDLLNHLAQVGEGHADTRLVIDLSGRDPDEGTTIVPYEKGFLLMKRLEQILGRATFDALLNEYFRKYAFASVTTADFLNTLTEFLKKNFDKNAAPLCGVEDILDEIQLYLNKPGLPPGIVSMQSALLSDVDRFFNELRAHRHSHGRFEQADLQTFWNMWSDRFKVWTPAQWQYALQEMIVLMNSKTFSFNEMVLLLMCVDESFPVLEKGNVEHRFRWFVLIASLCGKCDNPWYLRHWQGLQQFLTAVGRGLYIKPIYMALADSSDGRAKAVAIFKNARPKYHAGVARAVAQILGLAC